MRVESDKKIFFNILGLNCSGTTIISKFFDSLENVFCWSEPLHDARRQNSNFILNLKQEFINSDFVMGGIKEVFVNNSGHDRCSEIERNILLFDLNIVVLRNPFSNIGSILPKAAKCRTQESLFEDAIGSYIRLFEFIRVHNCVVLSYEKFCADPINHLIDMLPASIKVVGPVLLKKDYENYTIGNKRAQRSTLIKSPLDRSSFLSREQKEIIEEKILPTYQKLI